MVAREESIVDDLDAKLQTFYVDALYDELYDELGRRTLVGASDGFGAVIYAIAPTGDLATVIDDLIAT